MALRLIPFLQVFGGTTPSEGRSEVSHSVGFSWCWKPTFAFLSHSKHSIHLKAGCSSKLVHMKWKCSMIGPSIWNPLKESPFKELQYLTATCPTSCILFLLSLQYLYGMKPISSMFSIATKMLWDEPGKQKAIWGKNGLRLKFEEFMLVSILEKKMLTTPGKAP